MTIITENKTYVQVSVPKKDVHAKLKIFYNPVMKSNRNISILLLNTINKKNMNLALPLAGSGIRGLRFLQELRKDKINHLFVNDKKEDFISNFISNLELNQIEFHKNIKTIKDLEIDKNSKNSKNSEINGINKNNKVTISNKDANIFLMNLINSENKPDHFCGYFDYIDLDPFGTPNPFLASAIARISRGGIIAITSTDTAALTGTYPKVTQRKYWSRNVKNYLMHEIGLRILIRKTQLLGVQYDKALIPILAYHKDHYFRIYFVNNKGKTKCDELLKKHQYLLFCSHCLNFNVSNFNSVNCKCNKKFDYLGPLWSGGLFDLQLVQKMAENNPFLEEQKFLDLLKEESKINVVGFHDLHLLAKKKKLDPIKIKDALKKFEGVRTHFSKTGIKIKLNKDQTI